MTFTENNLDLLDQEPRHIRWATRLFFGDRIWGLLRLLAALGLIAATGIFGYKFFEDPYMGDVLDSWRTASAIIDLLPDRFLVFMIFLRRARAYIFLSFASMALLVLMAGRYIQQAYGLPRYLSALQYFCASFFGLFYPRLTVDNGQSQDAGEHHLLLTIGGPGILIIHPGNAALLERAEGPSRVLSAGNHFVNRFEIIRETINLEDQQGYIDEIPTTTKDGVPVVIRAVNYRYRLFVSHRYGTDARKRRDAPYPYSRAAAIQMTYNRTIRAAGEPTWGDQVQISIRNRVSDYIQDRRIDDINAPQFIDNREQSSNPRRMIAEGLQSAAARQALRGFGAELLWIDIGHFEVMDKRVETQRAATWGAKWLGNAAVKRSYGEAQRISFQEIGRAEAQAEMLLSILESLEGAEAGPNSAKNVRKIMLARTAQLLDGMAENGVLPPGRSRNELPPPTRNR